MYLTILILPLLGSFIAGFMGRKIGVFGAYFITCTCLFISSILASIAFYEVGLSGSPVTINLASWIDLGDLTVSWEFNFDQLTVSMLLDYKESTLLMGAIPGVFEFKPFYNKFSEYYPNLPLPKKEFLEWFIGFSEGEASFIVQKRGDFCFSIGQSSVDVQVLDYIKNNLGFGNIGVLSAKKKMHIFRVQDLKNLYLLCLLFNGNMVLPTRSARFIVFLASFNEKLLKINILPIVPNTVTILPSLLDCWLLGFVDGEGCFSLSFLKSTNGFRMSFIITQKWDVNKFVLEHILTLFNCNGSVLSRANSEYWDLKLNGLYNCSCIFTYFDKFGLKTKKHQSYLRWKELHSRIISGEHLNGDTRKDLIELASQINKFY